MSNEVTPEALDYIRSIVAKSQPEQRRKLEEAIRQLEEASAGCDRGAPHRPARPVVLRARGLGGVTTLTTLTTTTLTTKPRDVACPGCGTVHTLYPDFALHDDRDELCGSCWLLACGQTRWRTTAQDLEPAQW